MPRPFVKHYDCLYADKDYDKDVSDSLTLLGREDTHALTLLELGCGTGNQTFRLAERFRAITAVEIDSDFVSIFQAKLETQSLGNVTFSDQPIEHSNIGVHDRAAAFFHVLNYIDSDGLADFLKGVAKHTKPGAAFVADVWHAEAALKHPPLPRTQTKRIGSSTFEIEIRPSLNTKNLTVRLDYKIAHNSSGNLEQFKEQLNLQLWPRAALIEQFDAAGFENVEFWDYGQFPDRATDESWRIWLRALRR